MAGRLPTLKESALPQGNLASGETKMCQAKVPVALYEATKAEWTARGLTARHVVIWAFREFLSHTNPRQAAKLKKSGYGE